MVILLEKSKYLKDNVKLMKEYDIPLSKVIRHADVTGKYCPSFMFLNSMGMFKSLTCLYILIAMSGPDTLSYPPYRGCGPVCHGIPKDSQ